MKPIFDEVDSLDKKCYEEFFLTPDILMENASSGIKNYIYKKFDLKKRILIVCGSGNNGADGIALARAIHKDYKVSLYLASTPKSDMAKIQLARAKAIKVNIVQKIQQKYDIIVDCIFGSGLNKEISPDINSLIQTINSQNAFKIACDIPSGLYSDKNSHPSFIVKQIFRADTTITMGALKTSLFNDIAKDFVGKIITVNLGVSQKIYNSKTNIFLLEKSDLRLPFRIKQNTHKGSFGHSCVISGESKNSKKGACILALRATLAFGSGLSTLVSSKPLSDNYEIMTSSHIPHTCNALAIGMGLGDMTKIDFANIKKYILDNQISCVLDADVFYREDIIELLEYKKTTITPHPKEFVSLLFITKIDDISIDTLVHNRLFYVRKFTEKYPQVTLLLKGANTIISKKDKIYIQPLGTTALSKGGMGDVLSGLILSLLSQGYSSIQSSINASLAHSLGARAYKDNNYSLSPLSLIEEVKKI